MTTTSDRDGTVPVPDPDEPFPGAAGDRSRPPGYPDPDDTQPVPGLPIIAGLPPISAPPTDPLHAIDALDPLLRAQGGGGGEHPTVILTAYGELPAYNSDNVLPSVPPGRSKAPRRAKQAAATAAAVDTGAGATGPREPRPRTSGPSPLGRVVLPLVLAFVSAVALVAGWMHLQDTEASSASAPPVAPVVVPSASASGGSNGQSSATPAASSSSVASQSPSSDAAAAESPSAVASAPVVPVAPSSAASPVVDRSVPVVVLNSTSRTGLAAKVASALRRDGWTVVSVGNYRGGRLAVTTVYADGHANAVATMRDDLRGGDRVRQPTGSMNPKRLTVVIGADYPRS